MNNEISVVIAIGGRGTRLNKVTGDIPKPLFPVVGIPTLKRTLNEIKTYNFKKIFLTTCFEKQLFIDFLNKENYNFEKYIIYQENKPLGECGALWKIRNKLSSKTLFINGDLIFSFNIKKLIDFHNRLNSEFTLVTHPSSHPEDSDMVSTPNGTLIENIFHKTRNSDLDQLKPLLGFSGISLFNTILLDEIELNNHESKPSLFGYLVHNAFKNKKRIFSYNTSEYIKDMGTEKRFLEVSEAIKRKIPQKKNYLNNQKALFIDRDNTIIKCEKDSYILSIDDIVFLKSNIRKLALLSKDFSVVAIVTNQPQISMGKLSLINLENINNHVIYYCRNKSLLIDTVIWCPHHPHKGYISEVEYLKSDCFCRKPNPGMLFQLGFERNIDLNSSLMVGDSISDKKAAELAGCNFININNL